MNLAGRSLKDAKMVSQQKCFKIKAKDAYLVKWGASSFRLVYEKPMDKALEIINSYKWSDNALEITEYKDGKPGEKRTVKPTKVAAVPQDVPDATTKKTGKPSK